jgi:hypothetical protein
MWEGKNLHAPRLIEFLILSNLLLFEPSLELRLAIESARERIFATDGFMGLSRCKTGWTPEKSLRAEGYEKPLCAWNC